MLFNQRGCSHTHTHTHTVEPKILDPKDVLFVSTVDFVDTRELYVFFTSQESRVNLLLRFRFQSSYSCISSPSLPNKSSTISHALYVYLSSNDLYRPLVLNPPPVPITDFLLLLFRPHLLDHFVHIFSPKPNLSFSRLVRSSLLNFQSCIHS